MNSNQQIEANRINAQAGPSSAQEGAPGDSSLEDRGDPVRSNGENSTDGDLARENGQKNDHRTSPKQIAANRRNALRSTGPRTPEGKQASRLNALTHGLRANEVIIPGQEDPAEFEAILRELCEDWEPEGHTEIHLVDQIALAEWRLRRVHRAELGETRAGILDATASDSSEPIAGKNPFVPPEVLKRSANGIGRLKSAVENAMFEFESKRTISRETCDTLDKLFGDTGDNPALWLRVWFLDEMPDWLRENTPPPDALKRDQMKPDRIECVREHLETCRKNLERLRRKVRQREKLAGEIELQRLSVPNGPKLETIQHYETAIKREMRRDIDQLERRQRRRRGEPQPPTVNVNVANDD